MTTLPAIPAARANQYRNRLGHARPFASLPLSLKSQVTFDHFTGLAMWCKDGGGHEPPPYWADQDGHIHNL